MCDPSFRVSSCPLCGAAIRLCCKDCVSCDSRKRTGPAGPPPRSRLRVGQSDYEPVGGPSSPSSPLRLRQKSNAPPTVARPAAAAAPIDFFLCPLTPVRDLTTLLPTSHVAQPIRAFRLLKMAMPLLSSPASYGLPGVESFGAVSSGDVGVLSVAATLPPAPSSSPLVPPLVLWPFVRVRARFLFAFFSLFFAGWVRRTDDVLVAFL